MCIKVVPEDWKVVHTQKINTIQCLRSQEGKLG